jgi:hypothetical protein
VWSSSSLSGESSSHIAWRRASIDLLASPSTGATCRGHALTYTPLCHEGGRCMRLYFRRKEVRWHSCRHPRCYGGMDVVVVE